MFKVRKILRWTGITKLSFAMQDDHYTVGTLGCNREKTSMEAVQFVNGKAV